MLLVLLITAPTYMCVSDLQRICVSDEDVNE